MKPDKGNDTDFFMSYFEGYDPAKELAEKQLEQDMKNEVNKRLSDEINKILLNQVYFKNEIRESNTSEQRQPIKILNQEKYEERLLRNTALCLDELKRYREKNAIDKPKIEPELLALNLAELMAKAQDNLYAMTQEEWDKKNKENWEIFKEAIEIKNTELLKKAIGNQNVENISNNELNSVNIPKRLITIDILEKECEQAKFYESLFTRDGYKPKKCVGCNKSFTPISPLRNPFSINSEVMPEPMVEQQVSCTKCGSKSYFKHGKLNKRGKDGSVVTIQKYQCKTCASFFNSSCKES